MDDSLRRFYRKKPRKQHASGTHENTAWKKMAIGGVILGGISPVWLEDLINLLASVGKAGVANPINGSSPAARQSLDLMQNKEAIVMKTNRNTTVMLKTFLCLPITALLLTAALAGPAAAEEGVPFKGVIEGTENFTFSGR